MLGKRPARFPSTAAPSQKTLADLQRFQQTLPENRKCANCADLGPCYVAVDLGTFVCTTCAGLHRELGHKVKSLFASKWEESEVQNVLKKGNKADADIYFAWWSDSCGDPRPSASQVNVLRTFINKKYVEQKWSNKPNVKINEIDVGIDCGTSKLRSPKKSSKITGTDTSARSIPPKQDFAIPPGDFWADSSESAAPVAASCSAADDFFSLGFDLPKEWVTTEPPKVELCGGHRDSWPESSEINKSCSSSVESTSSGFITSQEIESDLKKQRYVGDPFMPVQQAVDLTSEWSSKGPEMTVMDAEKGKSGIPPLLSSSDHHYQFLRDQLNHLNILSHELDLL